MRKDRVWVGFIDKGLVTPSNIVLPLPSATGRTTNWYSSIRLCCASWEAMVPLPKTMMSLPGSCLIFSTSRGSNLLMIRVFFHLASFSVREKTILIASLM